MCFKLTGPRKYALALVNTENTHLLFHDYLRSIFRRHISWRVLKIAFRSLQIWKFPWEDTPRPPYKSPAFGTRDNAPPSPVTKNLSTALVVWIWPLAFFWRHSKNYKTEAMFAEGTNYFDLSNFYCFYVRISVTYRAPKFTATFPSELYWIILKKGLDKGYFDGTYGTFLLWLC